MRNGEKLHATGPTGTAAPGAQKVRFETVDESSDGQRLDNFLVKILKGVPKTHVYRLIRSGEVRVNKGRARADTRLETGDVVRVPPVRTAQTGAPKKAAPISDALLPVLWEDRDLLIVNKPAGLAAHGGSGIDFGLIERLRAARPQDKFLELAHRLDRDTSGVLVVCRTRRALVRFQEASREGRIEKHYRLLVRGDWVNEREHVKLRLSKYVLPGGERRVKVDPENGLFCHTVFTLLERFGEASLLDARLLTGRTHQIRVHAAARGFPIVGDAKYGEYEWNREVEKGLLGVPFRRMFLHAFTLRFEHPVTGEPLEITAPLPPECREVLASLEAKRS